MFLKDSFLSDLLSMDRLERMGKQLYLQEAYQPLFQPRTYPEFLAFVKQFPLPDDDGLKEVYSKIQSQESSEQEFLTSVFDVEFHQAPRYNLGIIHSHDYFELLYMVQGSCTQLVRSTTLDMQAGDFMILSPSVPHYVQILDDSSVAINITIRRSTFERAFFSLFSDNDILSDYFAKVLYGKDPDPYIVFRTGQDYTVMQQVFDLMYEYQHSMAYSRQALNNGISNLFIYLLRYHQENAYTGANAAGQHTFVLPLLQYIQAHCETVTLEELSDVFHYQASHVSREIKKSTGMTFSEIKQRLRLQRAVKLLDTTTLSYSHISDLLGYADTSHFYKQFRQYYGSTPKQYRNRKRLLEPEEIHR